MPRAKKLVGEEANFKHLFRSYKRSAKKRNHAFELSPKRFRELTKSNCYLCGCEPKRKYIHDHRYPAPYICNGIDRFDNSLGYIEGNVIACCGWCNQGKGKLSIEQFMLHVYDIYKHSIEKALNEGVPDESPD